MVTRDVAAAREKLDARVMLWSGINQQSDLNAIDGVINLAGEPIADKRWTEQQKQRLCESRWQITEQIVSLIPRQQQSAAPVDFRLGHRLLW